MDWIQQINELDIGLLRMVHHNRVRGLDDFLYVLSFATTYVSISILLVILFMSIKRKSAEIRIKFFKVLGVLLLAAIISLSLKYLIERERPFVAYPDIQKLSEAGSGSFPSGHTLEAFAIAFAISRLFPKRTYRVALFIWASLIAYSRMALGVHYAFDVLGGLCIGLIVSHLTLKIFDIQLWKKQVN